MFCSEQLHGGLCKGASVIALSAIAFVAAGCAAGGGISPTLTTAVPAPTVKPGHITGLVHGGQQPISGATVQMWAAGTTTGYGAGAVAVGSPATTDSNGNFDLNPGGGGSSACANGQFNYITATGGSSQGAGGTVNSVAALMLALPAPCNKVLTGGLSIVINEVTTVASVWALQQFISITPANGPYTGSAVPWQIGSDTANVTGLTNAFAQVSQLVNIATGQSTNSTLTSTVTGNSFVPTLTFTTTIVPDANRIYILADILAACINTADAYPGIDWSLTCGLLFGAVSPAIGGAIMPTDTIQAAYDIATAPGGITEYNIAGYSGTIPAGTPLNSPAGPACSSVGCEWALQLCERYVTATPPFPPSQACTQGSSTTPSYPTDYAIGVQWSAVDNNGLTYGKQMGAIAVDSVGNIWTGNTGISPGTGYPLVEWSPQGFVMQAVGGTFTMPSSVSSGVFVTSTSGTPIFNNGGAYTFSFPSTPPTVTIAPGTSPFTPYGLSINYINGENMLYAADYGAGVVGGGPLTSNGQSFYPGLVLGIPTTGSVISGAMATSTASAPTPYITGSYPGPIAVGNLDYGGGLWVGSNPQTGSDLGGSLTWIYMGAGGEETEQVMYEGQYIAGGFDQILIDGLNGLAWGIASTNTPGGAIYRNTSCVSLTGCIGAGYAGSVGGSTNAYLTSLNISGTNYASGSTPLIPSWGALDQLNNMWVGEGQVGTGDGRLAYLPTGFDAPPPPTVYIASAPSGGGANDCTGGLLAPISIAVDGLGNVFVANGVGVGDRGDVVPGSGISEFTGSGTPLSPTNYPAPSSETSGCSDVGLGMPAFGFNQDNTFSAVYANLTIDSSGNLWPGAQWNTQAVVHMVGLAAPVATPISAATYPNFTYPTAWSASTSTCGPSTPAKPYYTVTFTGPNSFKAPTAISEGQYVLPFSFGSGSGAGLNYQQVEVLTASSTQFTACMTGVTPPASGGPVVVQYSQLGTRP